MTLSGVDDSKISAQPLARAYFERATAEVAKDLLGKILVREHEEGSVAVRLTEVEAYLGPEDPACHTFGGRRTPRVRSMWGEAGKAYVYLIYGVHHCINVVTVGGGAGEAVLLRAGIPLSGRALIRRRRGPRVAERDLLNGPGKLALALAVDRRRDGHDLCRVDNGLWIGSDEYRVDSESIVKAPRIGLGNVGDAALWPLNFSFQSQDTDC